MLGAAGGIGQPLALLLKGHPAVGELRLYDVVGTAGVGADIGHINTQSKVRVNASDGAVNMQGTDASKRRHHTSTCAHQSGCTAYSVMRAVRRLLGNFTS